MGADPWLEDDDGLTAADHARTETATLFGSSGLGGQVTMPTYPDLADLIETWPEGAGGDTGASR